MSLDQTNLTCIVTISWSNKCKQTLRTVSDKNGVVRITRDGFGDMFLDASGKKLGSHLFQLKNFVVHKRFMTTGKSSINFEEAGVCVMLSNAPPSQLIMFLKTLYVKLSEQKARTPVAKRLMDSRGPAEEISPMTNTEILRVKDNLIAKGEIAATPKSRKREASSSTIDTSQPRNQQMKKRCFGVSIKTILTPEQDHVLQAVLSGKNVFFTGSAGTGKSYLLRRIIDALPPDTTFPTASTGVAACQIGGYTLHSFAGIGLGTGTPDHCVRLAQRNHVSQTWRSCKVLIIDEISMVDGNFFDKLDYVGQTIRSNSRPFGGIQLVLCGDFLQLPPVSKSKSGSEASPKFAFQSKAWDSSNLYIYDLPKVHRQTDSQFIDILQSLRVGRVTEEISTRLQATANQIIETEGIQATRLCSLTKEAGAINSVELAALTTPSVVFEAVDSEPGVSSVLDTMTPVEKSITLKVGAQVMLMKNLNVSTGLVNGARGVVTDFNTAGKPVVRFVSGEVCIQREKWVVRQMGGNIISRSQIPLKLAWAISIHKSQGLTLDCVEVSLGKVFEAGQAYVALSRAKSLATLKVLDFDAKVVFANPDVLSFYRKLTYTAAALKLVPLGAKTKQKETLFHKLQRL